MKLPYWGNHHPAIPAPESVDRKARQTVDTGCENLLTLWTKSTKKSNKMEIFMDCNLQKSCFAITNQETRSSEYRYTNYGFVVDISTDG